MFFKYSTLDSLSKTAIKPHFERKCNRNFVPIRYLNTIKTDPAYLVSAFAQGFMALNLKWCSIA
jgi:hypothetical protein